MQSVAMGHGTQGASAGRWTWAWLAVLLAWDAGGQDLALARLVAGPQGFALKDLWVLSAVLHEGARQLAWLAGGWLLAGVWWPTGVLRRLTRRGRLQWLASTAVSLAFVSALKYASPSSCPWDLAEFGGVAHYVSHWHWGGSDGGPGRCFPAGHASAAFAFLGGYFVLRRVSAARAAQCLAIVLAAGTTLGLAQQLRGAHFMSHTLWTAWICWAIAGAIDRARGAVEANWQRIRIA